MAKKIHVHVYEVVSKAEIDFDSEDWATLEQCQAEALEMAEQSKLEFKKSDCKFITLGFDNG